MEKDSRPTHSLPAVPEWLLIGVSELERTLLIAEVSPADLRQKPLVND